MKRKVLGLNAARLYGVTPDVTKYTKVPDDYRQRLVSDAQLMRTMEYDDRLPNELPTQKSHAPSADRGDQLQKLRTEYRQATDSGFGVPHTNKRDGWIRVR
jgi:hypothetical protein